MLTAGVMDHRDIGKHLVDGLGDFQQSHSVMIVPWVGKRTLAHDTTVGTASADAIALEEKL
jgi:hypothetical protein